MTAKAVALYSGGLDSTLSVLVMKRLGVEVTAVTFLTHFGCDVSDRSSCSKDPFSASLKFGFTVKLSHLSEKFVEIVKDPKHGRGRNMNPCIDCRILMLREAKALMEILGADFVLTGEVLGQRPMSQRKECFPLIDRESGLKGLVLRPLSAKLLGPTIPETEGLVDRTRLYDFSGRSRKPQMALAEEFGLAEYPNPAGGCLLTDPVYSWRLRDLLSRNQNPTANDLSLLRTGRHFKTPSGSKIVIGRDERENSVLNALATEEDTLMWVEDCGSPLAVLRGETSEEGLACAASLCARYSDAKHLSSVSVTVRPGGHEGEVFRLAVKPAEESLLEALRVEDKTRGRKKKAALL